MSTELEVHPGTVVTDDKVRGVVEEQQAADLPESIAWVDLDGRRVPVVRIEVTGTRERLCITKFGPEGAWLETTTMATEP
jgi:hypothetical protein